MRHALQLSMIAIACILPAASHAQSWTGNINAVLGVKTLDEDDWKPAEEQDELGILVDFGPASWPVAFAAGVRRSNADETVGDPLTTGSVRLEAEILELSFGVRKIWTPTRTLRPYIGGGVTRISAEATGHFTIVVFDPPVNFTLEMIVGPEDDDAIGPWVGGGLYWTLGDAFNIGLDLRYSSAEVSLFDVDADAGGTHAGLMLGYHR